MTVLVVSKELRPPQLTVVLPNPTLYSASVFFSFCSGHSFPLLCQTRLNREMGMPFLDAPIWYYPTENGKPKLPKLFLASVCGTWLLINTPEITLTGPWHRTHVFVHVDKLTGSKSMTSIRAHDFRYIDIILHPPHGTSPPHSLATRWF